jgi:hypothetical protein
MRKFIANNLWIFTTLLALCLLVAHTFPNDKFHVDSTSVILLIIVFISPFISAIRKIKYGDFEAEIDPKEVDKIKNEIEGQDSPSRDDYEKKPEIFNVIDSILELAENDTVLALAKLRIEIEKIVTRFHEKIEKKSRFRPMGRMIAELSKEGLIQQSALGPLKEVISICNRAVHGETIRDTDAMTITDIGTRLLADLYFGYQERILEPTEKEDLTKEEMNEYWDAKYEVTTVVPLVEKPYRSTRIVNQEELDELLEGYEEYAEFLVGIRRIEE